MAKNDNMLAILWLLNAHGRLTAKEISEKLEVNIRTVYRYIDSLSASGVPIIADAGHNGGYSLLHPFVQAPLIFDTEEKKALLQAAIFATKAGYPLKEALNRATSKLKTYANQTQIRQINHQLSGLDVINSFAYEDKMPILKILEHAIEREVTLEMAYRTGHQELSRFRRFNPYGLLFWNEKWYTAGYCHYRDALRSFRVDRIIQLNQTNEVFKRPKDFSLQSFFISSLLPQLSAGANMTQLVIEGRTDAIDDLCQHWFMANYLMERNTHQATFNLDAHIAYQYVPYFILPFGRALKIIEPLTFRQRLAAVASDLMAYYSE